MKKNTSTAMSIKRIYKKLYGEDFEKRIFENNIDASLDIILSDKQTCITAQEFIAACEKAAKKRDTSVTKCKNGTITIDPEAKMITLKSLEDSSKHYLIKFALKRNMLSIENYCEVAYKDSVILCNIPEKFTKNGSVKDETSEFLLPKALHTNTSTFDRIFYTTAESSICRAIGTEELSVEELQELKSGKILEGENGFAQFDNEKLIIESSNGNVKTSKSYRIDSMFGTRVIYNKYEEIKLENETQSE